VAAEPAHGEGGQPGAGQNSVLVNLPTKLPERAKARRARYRYRSPRAPTHADGPHRDFGRQWRVPRGRSCQRWGRTNSPRPEGLDSPPGRPRAGGTRRRPRRRSRAGTVSAHGRCSRQPDSRSVRERDSKSPGPRRVWDSLGRLEERSLVARWTSLLSGCGDQAGWRAPALVIRRVPSLRAAS
jgi:hypothetical protein